MTDTTKTFYADAGKGDRPRGTGWKNYYDNWDAIFGKKEEIPVEESGCSANAGESAIVEVIKADEG